MPLQRKYYFGRLNLIATYSGYEEKTQLLIEGFKKGNVISKYKYQYTIISIDKIEDDVFGSFITGLIVKFKRVEQEEVIDLEAHELSLDSVINKTAAKVRFFVHPKTGLFIHHAAGNDLKDYQVRGRVSELLEDAYNELFFQAKIEAVKDRFEILEEIPRFSSIHKLEIELHTSNPNSSDMWEDVDERLQELGTGNYKEEHEAGNQGTLSIEGDQDIERKLTMAIDGYGAGKLEGLDQDGKPKTVTTYDQPKSAPVPVDDSLTPSKILGYLRSSIEEVMTRLRGDE